MSVRIINADVLDGLSQLADESVHCVCTSPPYFALRSYLPEGHPDKHKEVGLEQTPDAYVARMVEVFREVRRVLRSDGVAWLNLGDSFCSTAPGTRNAPQPKGSSAAPEQWANHRPSTPDGMKPKDLMGIPWMVAFALRADGWYLRRDIIWHKESCMPESVRDRCTSSHEYVFMLTKSARYFYDWMAIAEPAISDHPSGNGFKREARETYKDAKGARGSDAPWDNVGGMRNKRSVWTINPQPFKGSHFATMPPDLAETCIKAGTSERGCCAKCGAPWERQTERERSFAGNSAKAGRSIDDLNTTGKHRHDDKTGNKNLKGGPVVSVETTGWAASCSCDAPTKPCTVLDPFGGAGTTGLVADRLQRNAVLIELNPAYAEMARRRLSHDGGMFASVALEPADAAG